MYINVDNCSKAAGYNDSLRNVTCVQLIFSMLENCLFYIKVYYSLIQIAYGLSIKRIITLK